MALRHNTAKTKSVTCPYCSQPAQMITGAELYPHHRDLATKKFWRCLPCDAYVGCHAPNPKFGFDGTQPLGTLANKALRAFRMKAHDAFDPLWREGLFGSRRKAYVWLAGKLELDINNCHISLFGNVACQRTVEFCNEYRRGQA